MSRTIAHVSVVVNDYDEAITFYTQVLGFDLLEDTPVGPGKRFVRVGPQGTGASLLLAKATTPDQLAHVGNQTGGRVFLFLHTDNFQRDFQDYTHKGVRFIEGPRSEAYGQVAVFLDLYGNKWDLVESRPR